MFSKSIRAALAAGLLGAAVGLRAATPSWTDIAPAIPTAATLGSADASVLIGRREGQDPIRSTDGGVTWTSFTVLGARPDRFIASPTDANVFYALAGGAATEFGSSTPQPSTLYRSRDAGASWEVVAAPFVTVEGAVLGHLMVGANPDLLFAARLQAATCMINCDYMGAAVMVSSDGGRSWRDIDAGLGASRDGRMIYPSASDARVVYVSSYKGLYRSRDQGASWSLVRAHPVDRQYYSIYQHQVVVDRRDPGIVYLLPGPGSEVWITEDGGDTWRTSVGLNVPGQARFLVADPVAVKRVYFIGQEGEVFESRDAARTWKRVANSAGTYVRDWGWQPRDGAPAIGMRGDARAIVAGHFTYSSGVGMTGAWLKRLEIRDDSLALGSDLWWTPSAPGTGLSITQHASGQMFVVWYGYEPGELVWRMMSGGTWTDARTFTGTLHSARGPDYFSGSPFDPARVSVFPVGSATLRFDDDNNAMFSYRLDGGAQGEKALTRFQFAPPSERQVFNYADLWFDPDAPGWGLSVSQQFDKVFLSWYAYDDQGRATWITVPDTSYAYWLDGPLMYKARYGGTAYAVKPPTIAGTARGVEQQPIGSALITFDQHDSAVFSYTVRGVTGTRTLKRLPY